MIQVKAPVFIVQELFALRGELLLGGVDTLKLTCF